MLLISARTVLCVPSSFFKRSAYSSLNAAIAASTIAWFVALSASEQKMNTSRTFGSFLLHPVNAIAVPPTMRAESATKDTFLRSFLFFISLTSYNIVFVQPARVCLRRLTAAGGAALRTAQKSARRQKFAERSPKKEKRPRIFTKPCPKNGQKRTKKLPNVPHNHDIPPVVISCTTHNISRIGHFVNGIFKNFL